MAWVAFPSVLRVLSPANIGISASAHSRAYLYFEDRVRLGSRFLKRIDLTTITPKHVPVQEIQTRCLLTLLAHTYHVFLATTNCTSQQWGGGCFNLVSHQLEASEVSRYCPLATPDGWARPLLFRSRETSEQNWINCFHSSRRRLGEERESAGQL